ncbi:MAG: cytochrome-c peroxidase [Verrucomicrobia bacterium]|nr:cytochrome-c peroxidase [Verrucomicrobiota bacterium]
MKNRHCPCPGAILGIAFLTFIFTASALAKGPEKGGLPGGGKGLPEPVTDADYHAGGRPNETKVILGNLLFFDKELSGNRNISCATCHHSMSDTGDGLSLPAGEGAQGLGVTRNTGIGADAIYERVPRNAPPVFNLGAKIFTVMFHDGRVQADPSHPSGFRTPAGDNFPAGLDNALAAQAMFPVTSAAEMAGQAGENAIADAAAIGDFAGPGGVWELLGQRLRAIPEYVELFKQAYPGRINDAAQVTYVDAANAIAAFEAVAWRADQSPFDSYLRGDRDVLSLRQLKGMKLFYGKAGCSGCHSGKFQTDLEFHSICVPQVGPGKGDGPGQHEDFGREKVTQNPEDRYRFRTPPLRNVALTAPYGHDGAFGTMEAMIRHHLNPPVSLQNYDPSQLVLPRRADLDALDLLAHLDLSLRSAMLESNELEPSSLDDEEIAQLVAFLGALTDPNSVDLRLDVPLSVPSGLPMVE